MSKVSKLSKIKKGAERVIHTTPLKLWIQSGMAAPGPPLGPQLGQRGINIGQFCKEFNDKTKDMKPGIPIPCKISVKPDRSFELEMSAPPITYFIRQASGAERGANNPKEEVAGMITVKHVYEIAKIKSHDSKFDCVPIEKIFQEVCRLARSCGVKVVHRLDEKEYAAFLEEREEIVKQQLLELEEKRQARMLRTT